MDILTYILIFVALIVSIVALRYSIYEFANNILTAVLYYRNKTFAKADLLLRGSYLHIDPYAKCRNYLKKLKRDDVQTVYGETFVTSMEVIASYANITSEDKVYDLGCGRGRVAFWLRLWLGCDVVGIDLNPTFIKKAQSIAKRLKLDRLEFKKDNVMTVDYADADVIYVYGSAFSDQAIIKLIENLKNLPSSTRIISVSYPLSDYAKPETFEVIKHFRVPFLWGMGDVYIQKKDVSLW